MKIFIYIVEWIVSFFAIFGMYYLMMFLFKKKFNPITAAIFGFVVVGLFVFLVAPYIISFPNSALVYTPSLLFWFVYFLYVANKEMS
jgi:hypothetical protein